jgi:hypothetical protein
MLTRRQMLISGLLGASSMLLSERVLAADLAARKPTKTFAMSKGMDDMYVVPASQWLLKNFGKILSAKVDGTPFDTSLLCAIACQESGYMWWQKKVRAALPPNDLLRLIVLDAVEPRVRAFPRDTEVFVADPRFRELAPILIGVSDRSREIRGLKQTGRLYFGYGLFQYDLQNIEHDPSFWTHATSSPGNQSVMEPGLWGDIGECTDRVISVLDDKYRANSRDIFKTVCAYNGRNANALEYGRIVMGYQKLIRAGIS